MNRAAVPLLKIKVPPSGFFESLTALELTLSLVLSPISTQAPPPPFDLLLFRQRHPTTSVVMPASLRSQLLGNDSNQRQRLFLRQCYQLHFGE